MLGCRGRGGGGREVGCEFLNDFLKKGTGQELNSMEIVEV